MVVLLAARPDGEAQKSRMQLLSFQWVLTSSPAEDHVDVAEAERPSGARPVKVYYVELTPHDARKSNRWNASADVCMDTTSRQH